MRMRVSSSCFSFPLLELENAARVLATLGFKYVYIGTWETNKANIHNNDILEKPQ
jgi:hypothetical protein